MRRNPRLPELFGSEMTVPSSLPRGGRRPRAARLFPAVAAAVSLLGAGPAAAQTPTPTPTPAAQPTATPTPTPTATPTPEPTPAPPAPGDPMVAAVGDIACAPDDPSFQGGEGAGRRCRMKATSDLVMNGGYTAALVLGDAQYEQGRYEEFLASYDLSWGRLLGITRPVAGNHEYFGDGAQGYFDYFNGPGNFSGRAGDRDKGYYSFDVGSWHVVAANSVCSEVGGCGPGSPQHRWLQADLAANQTQCTLVMWHHAPLTSSGPGWPSMRTFWQTLYDAGADVLLTGHAHNYERFAPLDPAGRVDPAQGIRQFVAGMGGKNLVSLPLTRPQTEARDATRFGILGLTLRHGSYDWRFVPASEGSFEDAGTSACHGPPPSKPAAATTGPARAARTSALLHAAIDGGYQATTYRFDYGRGPRYGSKTSERPLAAGSGLQQVSVRLGKLKPGQRYYYRVVATNGSGARYGVRRSFTARTASAYPGTVLRTPGLRAYWRLDDPGGGLVFDERARQLGWSSGSDWQVKPGALADGASLAAEFDGAGRSAVVNGPSITANGTLEGWFRWRSGTVLLRDDSATGGWLLGWDSRGRLGYRIGGRAYATERSIHAVRDSAWHHLALTKAGGLVQVFVDGRYVGGATDAPSEPSTSPWHIMRNGPLGQFSEGAADEVAIYDRALSGAEVRRHYEAGVARRQPATTVIGPAGPTNDPTPLFESRSSERRSTFRCSLSPPDRRYPVFTPCRDRRNFGRLKDGTYVFAAYAVDADGHPDPDPVSRTFTVDTVVPALTVGPVGQTLADVRRRGLRVAATCSEACTVVARMSVEGALARRVGGRRARRVEVASGTVRGAPGAATTVVARLDRRARERLAKAKALPVLFEVLGTDAAGNRRRFAGRVTLSGAVAPAPTPAPPASPAPGTGAPAR